MIVDDELTVRELVERSLRRQGCEVVVAQSGMEAIDLLRYRKPDVVILDIGMPGISGIEVCRFMRTNPSLVSIPILFLTGKQRIEDKIIGFEAGADDYLTKPFDIRELELRVKALLNRVVRIVPEGPLIIGNVSLDPSTGEARIDGDLVDLTPVEFELLYYMASRVGEVFSTERLLREVWGYPPGIGNPSLVRMHVLNLRRKIEKDPSHPTYLCTIPRHGYTVLTF
jgi:DNA-binding response OmpR family regulator